MSYDLIAKYLSGECSEAERLRLDAWRKETPENDAIFAETSRLWASASAAGGEFDAVRSSVLERIQGRRRKTLARRWLRAACGVAAGLVLFAGGLLWGSRATRSDAAADIAMVTVSTAPGEKSEVTLPDGTHIWLNGATRLSYPTGYSARNRQVTLAEGEAYFDVAKSESSRFLLQTPDFGIKVYGTRFNVRRYARDDRQEVTLDEGRIEVLGGDGRLISAMHPGQKYTRDATTGNGTLSDCEKEHEGLWRLGELRMERETLPVILEKVGRWYGVRIQVDGNDGAGRYYWMTLKSESLREALGLLEKIAPIRYQIEGEVVKVTVK